MGDKEKVLCAPIYVTCYNKKRQKMYGFTFYVRSSEKTQAMYNIFMKLTQWEFGNVDLKFGEEVKLDPSNIYTMEAIDQCFDQNFTSGMLLARKVEG